MELSSCRIGGCRVGPLLKCCSVFGGTNGGCVILRAPQTRRNCQQQKLYALQLNRLAEQIEEKRPYTGRGRRPVILQHDNATPHRSFVAYQTINDLQWDLLPHPAYSPDIARTEYHLFHSFQNILAEEHFESEDEVRRVIDEFIASKDQAFWRREIHQLPER